MKNIKTFIVRIETDGDSLTVQSIEEIEPEENVRRYAAWLWLSEGNNHQYRCSSCGYLTDFRNSRCPCCGFEMEETDEEDS